MNFLHPTFHDISLINAVIQANEEEEHERLHRAKPVSRQAPEAWSVRFARRHPRIFSVFSFLVVFGLIVFIFTAVWEYLF